MLIQKTADRPLGDLLMNTARYLSLCAALLALVSCNADHGPSVAGTISFKVKLKSAAAPGHASASALVPLDCSASGVSLVTAAVYDSSNAVTATGGPWECAAHGGSITAVPPGFNLKVLILGKDANGTVLYRGEQKGLSVFKGKHVNAGIIVVSLFTPELTSPSDGSSVTNGVLHLEWSGAGTSYRVQVSTSKTFDPLLIDDISSTATYTSAAPLVVGDYYWHVNATDELGNVSTWSNVSGFTVTPPPAPVLSAPSEAASVTNGAFVFNWTGTGSSYRIQVSPDASFASTTIDDTSAATSYTQKILLSAGTYYWRVQSLDAFGGTSDW